MNMESTDRATLGTSLRLRCGLTLKNRLVKAAMSDGLGDGAGGATDAQQRLYRRWMSGGMSLAIIGEVQVDPRYPEKPGNLVLDGSADERPLRRLAEAGAQFGARIWPQLGHAGAMADPRASDPVGPSELNLDRVTCAEITIDEIRMLPERYGRSARLAQEVGFSGVEIHAAHGFLLSQFLSPLFNRRSDGYGGPIESRARLLLEIIDQVRSEVGTEFAIGVKMNATDELVGGITYRDSLRLVEMLDERGVDVIDISGGTYFPGAPSSSERSSSGPYYADFAREARQVTDAALMLTGGFKTRTNAESLIAGGSIDLVGLARPLVLDPDLPNKWVGNSGADPAFPRFESPPMGGVTAWYTMQIAALAGAETTHADWTAQSALHEYDERDARRAIRWRRRFDGR